MTKTEYQSMVEQLEADARELIATGEPDLCASYQGFLDTMWSDDHDMIQRGATREEYEAALRDVFDMVKAI